MKNLSLGLRDEVKVDIEQATCASIALDVRAGITSISDVDGNYMGGDPNAVSVEVGLPGHDVIWRGAQVPFLEFGTGAAGAAGAYPNAAMAAAGYHPDPTKQAWVYLDDRSGEPTISFGLLPQAPMANAAAAMRHVSALAPARQVIKEALLRAVTV
jgi:hypothetical protein